MDFRELQYILLVAKTKNITKAAEFLHISQPSLSQFVRKVEREMGCELFHRGSRGIELTLAGEEYIDSAREILIKREELRLKIDDLSKMKRGRLTLGVTTQRGGHLLPEVISAFKREYPGVEMKILERLSTDELEEVALDGGCDVFVANLPLANPDIAYRTLIDDCLCLVLPPDFSLPSGISGFSFDKTMNFIGSLRNAEFILPPTKMKMGRLIKSLFILLGFEPHVILETHSTDTAQYMVLGGVGITFTQRSVFLDHRMQEKPIYIPIDDPRFRMPLVAGFSNRSYISNIANVFYSEMRRILQERIKENDKEYNSPG